MPHPPSAVETFRFRGTIYYIKRDDTLDTCLSGNKYRKLYTLLQTPKTEYEQLISHGGVQSNAMVALACLCAQKGWEFHYYTKHCPPQQKVAPSGNLQRALALGMQLHECGKGYDEQLFLLRETRSKQSIFIPQGGADPQAEAGVQRLAEEIEAFRLLQGWDRFYVATPSGTGTTAYYLARHLPEITVLTTPLVGDEAYLKEQMLRLGAIPSNLRILETSKRYRFAKPYSEFYEIWHELCDGGVLFDLIYAPKLWHCLDAVSWDAPVLYVHSGGTSGNATMLERYGKGTSDDATL